MKHREMKRRLKAAVSHAVPDNMKEGILTACENEKGRVLPMTQAEARKKRGFIPWIAAAAAACVALACIAVGYSFFGGEKNYCDAGRQPQYFSGS